MRKDILMELIKVQSVTYNTTEMYNYITEFLEFNDIEYYDKEGNIYATKGDGINGFPCIVSHTDTVHDISEYAEIFQTSTGNLIAFNPVDMEQIGTGGDDKVGIWVCLNALLDFDDIKCVFFRDEETGCVGSSEADLSFFEDVNFVLQCDRAGNTDFVTNSAGVELSSKAFRKAVKNIIHKHGYDFYKFGGLTDVSELKTLGVGVSMANIACGYYKPHQKTEYINLRDVENVYSLVCGIIKTIGETKFEHKYINDFKYPKSRGFIYYRETVSSRECGFCGYNTKNLTYDRMFNCMICETCKKDL